jgi:hypothetical protein
MDENDLQNEKHDDSSISTLHGIAIDCSDDFENTSASIPTNREFHSKEMNESD